VAATRYLLDTNILSALIKDPAGPLTTRIAEVGEGDLFTNLIVACELRYGALKKGSPALTEKVDRLLNTIEVLPLDEDVAIYYAEIRTALERAGTPIGANDYLIAAQALALDMTLVTDNVAEFSRVANLRVENWLTPG
jgi:tRNA(fMet)-specific endonuclease VapC